jgi:hypothetical protein
MRLLISAFTALLLQNVTYATGLATCNSGEPSTWQSKETLTEKLVKAGWEVRLVKVDGGCYEVYAINDKKERTEAYFHPVTLERVEVKEDH